MYLGNTPATSFESVKKDRYTGLTGTSVTLSHAVSTVADIVLWINSVKQDYTSYSVNQTALTVGGSLVASDIVEVAYLGRTFQTVNPPNSSVGASQIVDASITSGKLASGVLPTNTPAFLVKLSSSYNIANNTSTKIQYTTEVFDTDNAFDNSTNYRFTVPSGKAGKYFLYHQARANAWSSIRFVSWIQVNGSVDTATAEDRTTYGSGGADYPSVQSSVVLDLDVGDYIEHYVYHNQGATQPLQVGSTEHQNFTYFGGYKIIGA